MFSFRGYEGIDNRENYGEHDIKIVRIDEAGSLDYIVYGYMNRGNHEGEVGIEVNHYDSLSNTNEELAFISSDKAYEVMKSELGQMMYVTEGGELYLMVDGSVYGIDLSTLEMKELIKGLDKEIYAVSGNPTVILHGRKTARTDRVIRFRSSTFPVKNIYHNRRQWKVCKTAWIYGRRFCIWRSECGRCINGGCVEM